MNKYKIALNNQHNLKLYSVYASTSNNCVERKLLMHWCQGGKCQKYEALRVRQLCKKGSVGT